MVYGDIVLWAVFLPIGLVALIYTIRAALGWSRVSQDAHDDYAYRQAEGMLPDGLKEADFSDVYRRVNGPRGETHVAAALWAVLLGTPIIAKILELLLEGLYRFTGRSRVFEPGFLVWQFFIFFGLFAAWAAIAYLVARRYHAKAPARFDEELKRQLS